MLTRGILAEERPKDCGSHVHVDHLVCSLTKGFAEVRFTVKAGRTK